MRSDSLEAAGVLRSEGKGDHRVEYALERKGETHTYKGFPLWLAIAKIDGADSHHPYQFSQDLWDSGYDVTISGADGYSATFNTKDIPYDALIISLEKDGTATRPELVGKDVSTKYWIKDPVLITTSLAPAPEKNPAEQFVLGVSLEDDFLSFPLQELSASPYYIQGLGGYTTSAGTYYEHLYGGVRFADFLQSVTPLSKDDTITVIAMDGYEMSYAVSDLTDTTDGTWILAFHVDGEYLPMDPGFVRTIKIQNPDSDQTGQSVPNIDGHNSARMVEEIVVSSSAYKDFSLKLSGEREATLDRSTLQAGISCSAHNTTVSYFNKKSGEYELYTGIPLYSVLAYIDDPDFIPHAQTDKTILSYNKAAAVKGYAVRITAADGYSIVLDSRELDENKDVILAMYQDDTELAEADWPLKLVWDYEAEVVPEGIKAVRNIVEITIE